MTQTHTCHCGKSSVHIDADPSWHGKCHCVDCQKLSGSGYMPFAGYDKDAVSWEGEVQSYRSSDEVVRYFCKACGSPLLYHADKSEAYSRYRCVFIGLMGAQSDNITFDEHIWSSQKRAWDDYLSGSTKGVSRLTPARGDGLQRTSCLQTG